MNRIVSSMVILAICGCSISLESARNKAINEFEKYMSALYIDVNLFSGPEISGEDKDTYIFEWKSLVPREGDTIIEISIPKSRFGVKGIRSKGIRDNELYLMGTTYFQLNKAMLTKLFNLPPTPNVFNEKTDRLRDVELKPRQLVDIANFVEIKRNLMNYHYESKGQYPDSLNVLDLDRLFIADQFGRQYQYENTGRFIVIGSQGNNGKWDFDAFDYTSIKNDNEEYLLLKGDDILVKFKPW